MKERTNITIDPKLKAKIKASGFGYSFLLETGLNKVKANQKDSLRLIEMEKSLEKAHRRIDLANTILADVTLLAQQNHAYKEDVKKC